MESKQTETKGKEARSSVSAINGRNIPGTKHPINYYVQSDPAVNDAHLETCWLRRVSKLNVYRVSKASLKEKSKISISIDQAIYFTKNIRIHDIMEAVDENFAAISINDKIETNILPKPFELVLTEKFWEQFSSQVYLFLHNISLEDVASDSMEPCQAVSSFAQA